MSVMVRLYRVPNSITKQYRKKTLTIINNYEHHVQTKAIPSAIKSERSNIYFEQGVLKQHFKKKTDIEKNLVSNGFFKKKMQRMQLILLN